MPVRATKRGARRTSLTASPDVLVCGASFAGLACARELAGSGASVLILDRYEIGERQTSACAAPTEWLSALGLEGSIRQTFDRIVVNTVFARVAWPLPYTFSTFDYPELCAALSNQCGDAVVETAKVEGITRGRTHVVHTDRGDVAAPLVVDALGWRRVLGDDMPIRGGQGELSRGLEVHPAGGGEDLEIWVDPRYVRAGYAWRFPAGDEQRIGIGSYEPSDHVKDETVRLAADLGRPPDGYQGNWIPHALRPATGGDVFFAGDSAGHCLPLSAEGIRTALYFGGECGRELRLVVEGRQTRAQALERYASFSAEHGSAFRKLLRAQHFVGRIGHLPLLSTLARLSATRWMSHWFFTKYLAVAPPPAHTTRDALAVRADSSASLSAA